jgi:hypothetical protein
LPLKSNSLYSLFASVYGGFFAKRKLFLRGL